MVFHVRCIMADWICMMRFIENIESISSGNLLKFSSEKYSPIPIQTNREIERETKRRKKLK